METEVISKTQIQKEELPINPEELNESRGFAKRFPTIKKRVLSILKNDEYARRNYLWLCLLYWAKCKQIKVIVPKENFQHVNSPESICRAFRKIMSEARTGNPKLKFLLNDLGTKRLRNEREEEIHNYFSSEKDIQRAKVGKMGVLAR